MRALLAALVFLSLFAFSRTEAFDGMHQQVIVWTITANGEETEAVIRRQAELEEWAKDDQSR